MKTIEKPSNMLSLSDNTYQRLIATCNQPHLEPTFYEKAKVVRSVAATFIAFGLSSLGFAFRATPWKSPKLLFTGLVALFIGVGILLKKTTFFKDPEFIKSWLSQRHTASLTALYNEILGHVELKDFFSRAGLGFWAIWKEEQEAQGVSSDQMLDEIEVVHSTLRNAFYSDADFVEWRIVQLKFQLQPMKPEHHGREISAFAANLSEANPESTVKRKLARSASKKLLTEGFPLFRVSDVFEQYMIKKCLSDDDRKELVNHAKERFQSFKDFEGEHGNQWFKYFNDENKKAYILYQADLNTKSGRSKRIRAVLRDARFKDFIKENKVWWEEVKKGSKK